MICSPDPKANNRTEVIVKLHWEICQYFWKKFGAEGKFVQFVEIQSEKDGFEPSALPCFCQAFSLLEKVET